MGKINIDVVQLAACVLRGRNELSEADAYGEHVIPLNCFKVEEAPGIHRRERASRSLDDAIGFR